VPFPRRLLLPSFFTAAGPRTKHSPNTNQHPSNPPLRHCCLLHQAETVSIYHKLAPALYYSPVPERLPSPTQLLYPPSPCSSTDEPILPAISRPSSRSPLPSLSTLASVALPSPPSRLNGGYAMTFATSSPGASTAGQGTTPPICQNCTTSTTPLWRRDEAGSVLCNACGLFLKLHGRPRPISLKTDVIKSRNRVKNSGQGTKKKSLFDSQTGLPKHPTPPRSENDTPPPGHRKQSSGTTSNRSLSPQSRSGTPLPPPSQIAPPSLFESFIHPDHGSPNTLPALNSLGHPSPGSTTSINDRQLEPQPPTLDSLIGENNKLKTRVAELELVNDLFRGRVGELENSEANARRSEISRREVESHLRYSLEAANKREDELKRKLDDAERELSDLRGDPPRKKVRVSDLTA